jgi:aldehyde dehydrogenase (NAD+)
MEDLLGLLGRAREYYQSGETLSYRFRKTQLERLKKAIYDHSKEIEQALYDDLRKNAIETWVTESGFLVAEINHTLKHLKGWMQREKVKTNLLNFPSKSYVYKEPLGVVLIIGPWNYPLQLLLTPLVGAIAAGNCALLKPSEHSPATSAIVKTIIEKTFPPEYISVVEGAGHEVVPAMINNFHFDHVFFTGGTEVGREIYKLAAAQLTPVTLELGGKSPCVVEEDANIEIAAKRIALTKFSNAGQMCVAPDYLLVHSTIKDRFIEALKNRIKEFYSDDPKTSYNYGRIINDRQFDRLKNYLQHGRIIYGGGYHKESSYLEPTLLEDVPLEAAVMGDEIFGTVLPIIPFRSFYEAKAIIDRNPDPLAFYLFTESRERQEAWISTIHFGGGCINNASWHLTNYNLPFGGRGNSGIGRYHGKYSFDLFSHHKAVMKTPTWFDPKIKYPPYEGKLGLFKKIIR